MEKVLELKHSGKIDELVALAVQLKQAGDSALSRNAFQAAAEYYKANEQFAQLRDLRKKSGFNLV